MKKAIVMLVFTLIFGTNFCYAVDVKPVRDQVLENLNSFLKFDMSKTNPIKITLTDDTDPSKTEDKNATLTLKFNASAKRRSYIKAKEEWEEKRQASDGTKVEIEEEGSSPSENSRLQDAMNRAQIDYQVHMAGERMCRTASASAYQAEVDGSDIQAEYFGDYLDKCFIINY